MTKQNINGVEPLNDATDLGVVGWSPIQVNANNFFQAKVKGNILVPVIADVAAGDALTATVGVNAGMARKAVAGEQIVAIAKEAVDVSTDADDLCEATLTLGM